MKKIKQNFKAGLILSSLLAAAPTGVIASNGTVTLCKSIRDFDQNAFEEIYGSLGMCVNLFTTMPVESCQLLDEMGLIGDDENDLFQNHGQCVISQIS